MEDSAANPYIIGTHWFQMVDDLPINVLDHPYPDLVDAAKQAHRRRYDLKSGKAKPYTEKPRYN